MGEQGATLYEMVNREVLTTPIRFHHVNNSWLLINYTQYSIFLIHLVYTVDIQRHPSMPNGDA